MLRIVGSEHDAWVGIAAQEALESIPRPDAAGWMEEPFAHPDGTRWAFVLSDLAPPEEGDVAKLSADWFPPSEV